MTNTKPTLSLTLSKYLETPQSITLKLIFSRVYKRHQADRASRVALREEANAVYNLNTSKSAVLPTHQPIEHRTRTVTMIKRTAKQKIGQLVTFLQADEPEFELRHTAQAIQRAALRVQRQIGPVAPPLRGTFGNAGS